MGWTGIQFLIGNNNHRLDILFSPGVKYIFIVQNVIIMNLEAYLLDFERKKKTNCHTFILSLNEFQKSWTCFKISNTGVEIAILFTHHYMYIHVLSLMLPSFNTLTKFLDSKYWYFDTGVFLFTVMHQVFDWNSDVAL